MTRDLHSPTQASLGEPLMLPNGTAIPNRLAKAAMTEGLADRRDNPTTELERLYRRWSEGGAGLLISGNFMVDRRYPERGGNVVLEDDSALDRHRQLARAGTANGNQFWIQLNHPGRQCNRMANPHPIAPSAVQLQIGGTFGKPRAMTEAEILEVIERFARSAELVREAGYTGVQIHSAHGYLGSQFLSPVTNRRTDSWGGSLENRARFLLETVRAVRRRVGADFPLAVKLNSADFQKGGFTLEECQQVAAWLGQEGIDLLEISGGTYESLVFMDNEDVRESTRRREAFFLEYAEAINRVAEVPLMVTGGFRSRSVMEQALAGGATDLIGMARPFCTDPDLARGLIEGRLEQVPCTESGLFLGSGFWGPNSPVALIRGINNQGQVAWFYQQIIALARGGERPRRPSVLGSFTRQMISEYRLNRRRRMA